MEFPAKVFSFSHPWLLFSPRFSTFPILGYYSTLGFPLLPNPTLAKILSFSSLVYNISHPWFFTFFNPWLLFSPRFFSFAHPWLLSCPWFSLRPTLGCYSALGFPLFPSLATIQPLVFHFFPPLAVIPPWACIRQVRVKRKCRQRLK